MATAAADPFAETAGQKFRETIHFCLKHLAIIKKFGHFDRELFGVEAAAIQIVAKRGLHAVTKRDCAANVFEVIAHGAPISASWLHAAPQYRAPG